MSIEVRIPKEITEYKEKIIFGLSIRQLLCFSVAIVIGITTYYFANKQFGQDAASYIVIAEVIPIFALGFFKKDGFNFEKYVVLVFRHFFGQGKRKYEVELNITKLEGSADNLNVKATKKTTIKKRGREKRAKEADGIFFERTKASSKAKSKKIKRSIKTARKEYKIAKRQAQKGA